MDWMQIALDRDWWRVIVNSIVRSWVHNVRNLNS